MEPIHKRVAGLDVHRMKHGVTVLIEEKVTASPTPPTPPATPRRSRSGCPKTKTPNSPMTAAFATAARAFQTVPCATT